MRARRSRVLMVGLVIGLLLGQWGCAMPMHPYHIPTPSEQVRAGFGAVGVASLSVVPESALQGPTSGKGSGAAKGAGLAAGTTFVAFAAAGLQSGNPYGAALGLALGVGLAPIAAVVGGIYGAVAAEPAEKVKETEAALENAFADLKVQEAIRDGVLEAARERTSYRLVPLEESADVDTILEVSVPSLGLAGPTAVNPPLSLIVRACPSLVRAADGAELYPPGPEGPRSLAYVSAPRKFVEWGVEDARPFREEMERAYQSLAEKIVEGTFLVYLPPGRRWTAESGPVPLPNEACPPARGEIPR